jgi:hypothetical protein
MLPVGGVCGFGVRGRGLIDQLADTLACLRLHFGGVAAH